jgi:hypothetical protein
VSIHIILLAPKIYIRNASSGSTSEVRVRGARAARRLLEALPHTDDRHSKERLREHHALKRGPHASHQLQGQPCGQVVTATQQGDNDYIASCQDGSRYRVFVNAQGRVVVQKQ